MNTVVAVLLLALMLGTGSLAGEPATRNLASSQSMHVDRDVMVPMRDGVQLATDIYRPAQRSVPVVRRLPVILMRTPYDKRVRARSFAAYFVSRGYVVVVQDVRGRYHSQGRWRPLYDDGRDGVDTAQWLGHQSWCDGNIGTVGVSYEGGTQHAMALANAPYIKAMIPAFAVSDVGQFGIRYEGAFELRWFNWVLSLGDPLAEHGLETALRAASDPAAAPALAALAKQVPQFIHALPLRAGTTSLKFAPDYESWLIGALSHGADDAFWKDMGVDVADHAAEYKDIPVYHMTGWYDSWGLQVANLNYPALRAAKHSQQRLIVGPWTHGGEGESFAGDAQFTADAAIDLHTLQSRWFDRWLKDVHNGVDREPPVRIYVMGGGDGHKTPEGRIFVGGHWRDEQEWPLTRARITPYYLQTGGLLSRSEPQADASITYRFDPSHPVPTVGGNLSSQGELARAGGFDQRCSARVPACTDSMPLSARNDVVVFQSAPLESDLEVTGPLIVKLWASSDAPDTDFTAKLIDVYPPNKDFPAGVDLNVGDGIVRARYRNGGAQPRFLEPGKPYEFTIQMYPTALVFKRGHRIRVDVSSSNFPRFDLNPNTGEPLNDNRNWRVAHNTIYLDPAHPSRILLPVVPAP